MTQLSDVDIVEALIDKRIVIDEVQTLSWCKNPDSPETELDAAYRETVRKYNEERKWLKK